MFQIEEGQPVRSSCDCVFALFYCSYVVTVGERSESWVQSLLLFDFSVEMSEVCISGSIVYIGEPQYELFGFC